MVKIITYSPEESYEKWNVFCSITIKIGQNATENTKLVQEAKKVSKENILWFHLSDFPSCHVLLYTESEMSKLIKLHCARLCKDNSKYKNLNKVKVDVLSVKYIKCTKTPGEVQLIKRPEKLMV